MFCLVVLVLVSSVVMSQRMFKAQSSFSVGAIWCIYGFCLFFFGAFLYADLNEKEMVKRSDAHPIVLDLFECEGRLNGFTKQGRDERVTFLVLSRQLRQAWNWLILSAESFISCCLCYAPGYDDLARVEQWGGAYAYTPLCAPCSTRSATRAVSRPPPEDHYKVEVSACKNYSPAILNILDTILNGKPASKDLDRFVKKLMSKRVFEEPGLVDCSLDSCEFWLRFLNMVVCKGLWYAIVLLHKR